MEIKLIKKDKKRFLDLLLLADEQEDMIDRYLGRGEMYALYDGDLKSICVVTKESEDTCELKSIATYAQYQGQGYGKALVQFILEAYRPKCKTMLVGTGETPAILSFYRSCGFVPSHRIANFFTDNYDHPIIDNGVLLVDMVYLRKDFI